ncbi:hypothetical protein HD554DRAFT_1845844 [Boletus coccyginus]|nr:hypothetical protein HD554DRAFT_1845844 [Boletus coccyginus]
MVFIAPHVVLPRVIDQLRVDIDAGALNALTEAELGIWETPVGTTYIDVLAMRKEDKGQTRKRAKARALEQAALVLDVIKFHRSE